MVPDSVVSSYRGLATSTLSDALDRLGLDGACPGLLPLEPGFQVSGVAYTLRYGPVDAGGGTVGDYVDDVPPGSVLVLDNGGRLDCTVWGDILTYTAHRRALGGTVVDGVCRDVARSLELSYPIFSRGRSMRTGKDRVRLEAIQVEVALGDVSVHPGDLVVGDADGVVVVAASSAGKVLEVALAIDDTEQRILAAVGSGQRLDDARARFGYHRLQSRQEGPVQ